MSQPTSSQQTTSSNASGDSAPAIAQKKIFQPDSTGEERPYYVMPDGTRFPADELSGEAVEAIYQARTLGDPVSITYADGDVCLATVGRAMGSRVVMFCPQGRPRGIVPRHPSLRSIETQGREVYHDIEAYR